MKSSNALPLLWAHFAVSLGFNLATSSLYYRISWLHKPTLLKLPSPSISPAGPHYWYRFDLLSRCRTAGGGGGTGHGTNLLKRKWTWMSGGRASSFPVISLGFCFFLISFIPSTFCFPAVPIAVVIPLLLFQPHLHFLPYFLSRVFILTFTQLLLVPL